MTREEKIKVLNSEFWSPTAVTELLNTTRQNLTRLKQLKMLVPVSSEHIGSVYLREDIVKFLEYYCDAPQKREGVRQQYQKLLREIERGDVYDT